MSANNINAFALSHDESVIYGGTKSGQLVALNSSTLETVADLQVHYGSIETVTAHPTLPLIGMLGKDRHISIFDVDQPNSPKLMHLINVRGLTPPDDPPIDPFPSTSQALTFHDTEMRFAGHSGNGGVLEMAFDSGTPQTLHCSRVHGNFDFVTARYVPGTHKLLTSTVRGMAYLTENGVTLNKWDLGEHNNRQTLHWFEPLPDGGFLVASDGQQIIRFDPEGRYPAIYGPMIARDHLEHVTYQKATSRAFCASFDRLVREISPEDCTSRGIVWQAPFKLRWLKTLESKPDVMLVNCRNGGLYQVSIKERRTTRMQKTTPTCFWSGAIADGKIHVFGEAAAVTTLNPISTNDDLRCTCFAHTRHPYGDEDGFYVKRTCSAPDGSTVYFGRTDGSVWELRQGKTRKLLQLPSAVRDMVTDHEGAHIYVATELGIVHDFEVATATEHELYRSPTPIWALAYHPTRALLAVGHRTDGVTLIGTEARTFQPAAVGTRFCKRMRWLDEDTLLIGNGGDLLAYSLRLKTTRVLVHNLPNTIEDFDWTPDRQYLVIAAYSRYLYLADLTTGKIIDSHGHEMDYAKGVLFLPEDVRQTAYPGDFLSFGRDGVVRQFRVHDDRIISLDHLAALRPWLPLTHNSMFIALSRHVRDYRMSPFGDNNFYGVSVR